MPKPITTYFGIDPGWSGGVAYIRSNGIVGVLKMPPTPERIWEWFKAMDMGRCYAAIELNTGYAGGAGNAADAAAFKFGMATGLVRMAITVLGWTVMEVTPQVWQRGLGIPPKVKHTETRTREITKGANKGQLVTERCGGETQVQWKNRLKELSRELFPALSITLHTSDALLIAEYCKRKVEGTL